MGYTHFCSASGVDEVGTRGEGGGSLEPSFQDPPPLQGFCNRPTGEVWGGSEVPQPL